jgi:hypothetical protein
MKLILTILALALLTGCQFTNRHAYRQGWKEGYMQADRYHHGETK